MSQFHLYSNIETKDTILDCWGASTKHPDSRFRFSNFEKTPFFSETSQVFQWLLECASKMTWEIHARQLAEFAMSLPRID